MTKLTGLNVEFTGDSSSVEAAAKRAGAAVKGVGDQSQKTGAQQAVATKRAVAYGDGFGRLGKMSRSSRNNVRNFGYQIQDMAVQMEMGTDTMRVMSMQLPQMLGSFGVMGALLGAIVGVTLPLVSALMKMGGAQDDVTFSTEKMTDALDTWRATADAASQTNIDLMAKFGGVNEGLRLALSTMEEINRSQALDVFDLGVKEISSSLVDLANATDTYTIAALDSSTSQMEMASANANLTRVFMEFADTMGFTVDQTVAMRQALLDLQSAKGPDEAQKAIGALLIAAEESGVEFGNLNAEAQAFFTTLIDMQDAAAQLSPPVMDAGTATELLVEAFRVARAEMWQLEGEAPAAFAAVSDAVSAAAARVASLFSGGGAEEPPDTPTRPGGGGASAAERAKQEAKRDLEQLTARLATEAEALASGYADQQGVLQAALDAKLISQDKFEALSLRSQEEYVKSMDAIDAARRNSAVSTAGDLFGQLAGLMSSENKKLFNIGKAAAIGEATINTYKGISESLAKYPMPVAGVFAAAHAAIGFANVAKIKATQFGGGGGAGGAGAVSTPSVADSGGGNSTLVNVTLNGDNFSQSGIRGLLGNINDVIGDGGRIRLT